MTRRWVLADGFGAGAVERGLVERVLASRGLSDPAAAAAFIEPKLTGLHDPALLPGLERAAERLARALAGGERVVIYGDYDTDGITATAILYHTFVCLWPGANVGTYVPHRVEEGYGLNSGAVVELARGQGGVDGARVIVTVDCGVTAVEPARVAREAGVDLIITDHHNLPEDGVLPEAYAVVHPRLAGTEYPYGDLCGAGVAYKLAWRLATLHGGGRRVAEPVRKLLLSLLAFAALGTIADVAPLTGENRVIVRHGLGMIRSSPFAGLVALTDAAGLMGGKTDELDVGFRLAPRLNAAGRLSHAAQAVELFTTAGAERAAEIAEALEEANTQRRTMERRIFEQACERAERAGMTGPESRAIVLAEADWHPGVVGIVCSRMIEKYGRPTILMQRRDGECHGSGRSIDGYSLHAALAACAEHLKRFGGHDMAAGLALEEGRLEAFAEALRGHAAARISAEEMVRPLRVDAAVTLEELTAGSVRSLAGLAPFGRGNPSVHVAAMGVRLGNIVPMGSRGDHLALTLQQGTATMRSVAWGWGERRPSLRVGATMDVVLRPALSTYLGRVSVEPEVIDVRLRGEGAGA